VNAPPRALLLVCSLLLVAAASTPPTPPEQPPPADEFVTQQARALISDANAAWQRQFSQLGTQYPAPGLVFFKDSAQKVCGADKPLTGAFYCPDERRVYIDLAFLQQLSQRRSSPADNAAIAYVIGHEIGHHVQSLLGTTALVAQARARSAPAVSARTWMAAELQADCYAGIWLSLALKRGTVHSDRDMALLLTDIAAISQADNARPPARAEVPDPVLTYGSAQQRLNWLKRGIEGAGLDACDTFSAAAAGNL
jgi:predicted metalloprotease